jgi:hypothetical protein
VPCAPQESDILFFYTQVHKLQPGFFIAVDREQQKLMWVIRGETHIDVLHCSTVPVYVEPSSPDNAATRLRQGSGPHLANGIAGPVSSVLSLVHDVPSCCVCVAVCVLHQVRMTSMIC